MRLKYVAIRNQGMEEMDQVPEAHEWKYFRRQEIIIPVERFLDKGFRKIRLKDDSGLIEKLKKYSPRKVSLKINSHSPVFCS